MRVSGVFVQVQTSIVVLQCNWQQNEVVSHHRVEKCKNFRFLRLPNWKYQESFSMQVWKLGKTQSWEQSYPISSSVEDAQPQKPDFAKQQNIGH